METKTEEPIGPGSEIADAIAKLQAENCSIRSELNEIKTELKKTSELAGVMKNMLLVIFLDPFIGRPKLFIELTKYGNKIFPNPFNAIYSRYEGVWDALSENGYADHMETYGIHILFAEVKYHKPCDRTPIIIDRLINMVDYMSTNKINELRELVIERIDNRIADEYDELIKSKWKQLREVVIERSSIP